MKVIRATAPGGPAGVRVDDAPEPAVGADEVRVRVRAAGLNRADLLQSLGFYPAPPGVVPDVPGLEYAGEIDQVGARVTRFRPGDRVLGLLAGGAWSEAVVAHEREVMALPGGLGFAEAAAIPEAFATAWDALVLQAQLRAGQSVLIHAVGSGVGTAALQLAKVLGAQALGTSRSASKLERAAALAPFAAIHVDGSARFADAVRAQTSGRGADVVLDLVGGTYFPQTLEATAPGGTVMVVGLTAGATSEVSLRTVLGRRLTVRGTTLRARPLEEKIALAQAFERQVLPLFAERRLLPVLAETVRPEAVGAALARMASNDTFGKTVVSFDAR